MIACGGGSLDIQNPAIDFTLDAKRGKYDSVTDEEYQRLLSDVEEESSFWHNQPAATASEILLEALSRTPMPDHLMEKAAEALAECSVACSYAPRKSPPGAGSGQDREWFDSDDELDDHGNARQPSSWTPKELYGGLCQQIQGQDDAKKAAAMLMYNHLQGRRGNTVFCGPSGCGKSEIWRALSRKFPGRIRMIDASRLSAEGWSGSVHLRDIFEGIDPAVIRQRGLIVVLDEADKLCCETIIGGNGTDHSALVQGNLLKMLDGDVIEFGAENKQPAFSVDCGKVSVVMLGAFENLLRNKSASSSRIGFGGTPRTECNYDNADITYDDLISAGMRREIAGRIGRIVYLRPLSERDYRAILREHILGGLSRETRLKVRIDGLSAAALARAASGTGLGVRWMRSQVCNAVDDVVFEDPGITEIKMSMDGEDGKLKGRAAAAGIPPALREPQPAP